MWTPPQAGLEGCPYDGDPPAPPPPLQVLFEALISPDRRGYMGLDDILLLSYPCGESPRAGAPGAGAGGLGSRLQGAQAQLTPRL